MRNSIRRQSWPAVDVCKPARMFAGSFSNNPGRTGRVISAILGLKLRCLQAGMFIFASRYTYSFSHPFRHCFTDAKL
jgi:hypothetical protein